MNICKRPVDFKREEIADVSGITYATTPRADWPWAVQLVADPSSSPIRRPARTIEPEDYRIRLVVQRLPGSADLVRDTE